MPKLVSGPTLVKSHGNLPKQIEEYIGRVNTGDHAVSVARMSSPAGWRESGQRPRFCEITLVLAGVLHVEHEGGQLQVRAGQAVIAEPREWVRYSTPTPEGAQYVAICLPAFSPDTVNRDEDG